MGNVLLGLTAVLAVGFGLFELMKKLDSLDRKKYALAPIKPTTIQKLNKNLDFIVAENHARDNIAYVYESVAEWVYNELSQSENKFYHFANMTFPFKSFLFNMEGYYKAHATHADVFGEVIMTQERFLLENLHKALENITKQLEYITKKQYEVPEELKQKINSLFWSL